MARVQLLNDVYTSGLSPRIILRKGIVYRVEVLPASAQVGVRSVRQPALPPLFLVPLAGGGPGDVAGAAFLVVPNSTGEYWIDLSANGNEPVRIRLETDPKEMSRWARIRALSRGQPAAGFSMRAVYLGAFTKPASGFVNQTPGTASAVGVEGCLAIVPHGQWIDAAFGGCVLAIARYARPGGAGLMWYIGSEPGWVVTGRNAPVETSIVFTLGIGTATGVNPVDYSVVGLGVQLASTTALLGGHLWPEAQAGFSSVHVLTFNYGGETHVVPHLAAGFELRF
jgi:hypothetical protein